MALGIAAAVYVNWSEETRCADRIQLLKSSLRSSGGDSPGSAASTENPHDARPDGQWMTLDLGFAETMIQIEEQIDIESFEYNVMFKCRGSKRLILFLSLDEHEVYQKNLNRNLGPGNLEVPESWRGTCRSIYEKFSGNHQEMWSALANPVSINESSVCQCSEREYREEIILEKLRCRIAGSGDISILNGKNCQAMRCAFSGKTTLWITTSTGNQIYVCQLFGWSALDEMRVSQELVSSFVVTDYQADKLARSSKKKPLVENARVYPSGKSGA
jgi:hypothetical protein